MNESITVSESENPTAKRSFLDRAAYCIATCGIGYMPIVPATWGSLLGVGVYLLVLKADDYFTFWAQDNLFAAAFVEASRNSLLIFLLLALFFIGVWASSRIVRLTGKKDPRIVIIDEIVGQLITFLFVPVRLGWWTILLGFFVFRFFDILKPYPANTLESLPTGLGVMADDVMAGIYSAAAMSLICLIYTAIW